jgi:hypothetical protein
VLNKAIRVMDVNLSDFIFTSRLDEDKAGDPHIRTLLFDVKGS